MSNQDSKKSPDKNNLYIGVFTLALIIIIATILIAKGCSNFNKEIGSNSASSDNTVKSISVSSEKGNQNETIKTDIKVRDVKFSQNIKKIKKYESKQKDTQGEPSVAKSNDGYTYLTYKYNEQNAPAFFGTKIAAHDASAMLVYVFHNDQLIELRIQYGNVGKDAYNNIVSNISTTYGNATYSRTYSNGAEESWWKTDKVTLDVICQDGSVFAYYRNNK